MTPVTRAGHLGGSVDKKEEQHPRSAALPAGQTLHGIIHQAVARRACEDRSVRVGV